MNVATFPTAPANVDVAVGAESGQLYTRWQTPVDDGGDSIDFYSIYVLNASNSSAPASFEMLVTDSLETNISGLLDGVLYRVAVSATNKAGESPRSVASAAIVPGT